MKGLIHASFCRRYARGPEIRLEEFNTTETGRVTVLFGASGAGKTTVLRCLAGLDRPDAGKIQFGEEIWFDSSQQSFMPARRRRTGFVPQEYALFPHLSVKGNIGYGLRYLPGAEAKQRVQETLSWLRIENLEERLPRQLSAGEQQRVALARALAGRPRLLLLDEPLSALDAPTRLRLRDELRHLLRELGIPTVLVTHDRTEALALGDDLVVMHEGKVIQQGPVREVFGRPSNLAVAGIVAIETVQPAQVMAQGEGLVTLKVGTSTLRALAGNLAPQTQQVFACIRAEDVILLKGPSPQSSARNSLPAIVKGVAHEGPLVRVDLDCGFPLMALLTKQACEELQLSESQPILALIKAPNIHLIPREG